MRMPHAQAGSHADTTTVEGGTSARKVSTAAGQANWVPERPSMKYPRRTSPLSSSRFHTSSSSRQEGGGRSAITCSRVTIPYRSSSWCAHHSASIGGVPTSDQRPLWKRGVTRDWRAARYDASCSGPTPLRPRRTTSNRSLVTRPAPRSCHKASASAPASRSVTVHRSLKNDAPRVDSCCTTRPSADSGSISGSAGGLRSARGQKVTRGDLALPASAPRKVQSPSLMRRSSQPGS